MIEIIPNWHPVLVHFTVALLSVSVAAFIAAALMRASRWRERLKDFAYLSFWLGSVITVFTAVAGWFAYNSVQHDAPSHAAMTEHRNWALVTLAVFIPLAVWSVYRFRGARRGTAVFLGGLVVGQVLLLSTAWHGGELVFRFGLGVMSLPKVSEHAHGSARESDGHAPGETMPHLTGGPTEAHRPEGPPADTDPAHQPHGHDGEVPHEHGGAGP